MTKMQIRKLRGIQAELNAIRNRLHEYSMAQMAIEMGYSSPNVLQYWFKKKRIPDSALKRVRTFLRKTAS